MKKLPLSIRLRKGLYEFDRPKVMGIINVTPDSFYAGSRTREKDELCRRIDSMTEASVDIFDVGGYSTRPGADSVSADEEFSRLASALETIRLRHPEIPVSVDTFRASVAERCIDEFQVDIINDIGGGTLDPDMFPLIAERNIPYILMHIRGVPATMQSFTDYDDVVADVMRDLAEKADTLHAQGVSDIILDPGFGFAKDINQNYRLLSALQEFKKLGMPVLAGLSRKSMIWKALGITPEEALPGTIALHTAAILNGADIIRVHDVAEAVQSVLVLELLKENAI